MGRKVQENSVSGQTAPIMARAGTQLALAAAAGVALSLITFFAVRHSEALGSEAQFLQLAEQRLGGARARVIGALDTVRLMASYFEAASGSAHDRKGFNLFVAPALSVNPLDSGPGMDPAGSARRARPVGGSGPHQRQPRL